MRSTGGNGTERENRAGGRKELSKRYAWQPRETEEESVYTERARDEGEGKRP